MQWIHRSWQNNACCSFLNRFALCPLLRQSVYYVPGFVLRLLTLLLLLCILNPWCSSNELRNDRHVRIITNSSTSDAHCVYMQTSQELKNNFDCLRESSALFYNCLFESRLEKNEEVLFSWLQNNQDFFFGCGNYLYNKCSTYIKVHIAPNFLSPSFLIGFGVKLFTLWL